MGNYEILLAKKQLRVGETRTMNNGLKATIIEYRRNFDIDIQFENGVTVKNREYQQFCLGNIKCPMVYEIIGEHVKCTNPNTKISFIIDIDDLEVIKGYWWCKNKANYISNHKFLLHNYLMNTYKTFNVDHINGDTTDNRKCNLRVCTHQQNCFNRSKSKNNKSGYKGVAWDKEKSKWVAQLSVNGKRRLHKRFNTAEQAAEAYNRAALLLHGEFARLNEIAS